MQTRPEECKDIVRAGLPDAIFGDLKVSLDQDRSSLDGLNDVLKELREIVISLDKFLKDLNPQDSQDDTRAASSIMANWTCRMKWTVTGKSQAEKLMKRFDKADTDLSKEIEAMGL